jgi:hypothetical protein
MAFDLLGSALRLLPWIADMFNLKPHFHAVIEKVHARNQIARDGLDSWVDVQVFARVSLVNDGKRSGFIQRWEMEAPIKGARVVLVPHEIDRQDGFWRFVVENEPPERRELLWEQNVEPGKKYAGWLMFNCPRATAANLIGANLDLYWVNGKGERRLLASHAAN